MQYKEVTQQTGVLTKLAVALITQNPWAAFAINTAADTVVSGEIDLENVAKDAAFTAFTAGVDIGGMQFDGVNSYAGSYADTLGLSHQSALGPRAGDLLSSHSITTGLIGATATGAVQTGLYGGSLGDNILDNTGSFAANQAMAVGFYDAGEFKSINDLTDGSAGGIAAHMLAGCAGGALTGVGCGEGAAAAGVNEFAAGHGWGSDTVKFTNMGTAVLLSHGDPTALGQLSGITATADRYNRQLHKIEDERLTKLKAGKTKEEQRRLNAAACYLIRCSAGIPKDDPDYATTLAMQELGAEYQDEIELLRGQVEKRPNSYREPTALIDEPLFTYSDGGLGSDAWSDKHSRAGNFIRLEGVVGATGSLGQMAGGMLLGGSTCAETLGAGCAFAVYVVGQSSDYAGANLQQIRTGKYATPLGEQVLQGFGLSPEDARIVYALSGFTAEGAAALRVGVTTAAPKGGLKAAAKVGDLSDLDGVFDLGKTGINPLEIRQAYGSGPNLSQDKINEILSLDKGSRPDPSAYMSKTEIEVHLEKFEDGAVRFFTPHLSGNIGPRDTFVFPKSAISDLYTRTGGNIRTVERELGLPSGYFENAQVAVIDNPKVQMPTGNEIGANDLWKPGGYTSGHIPEAILPGVISEKDVTVISPQELFQ